MSMTYDLINISNRCFVFTNAESVCCMTRRDGARLKRYAYIQLLQSPVNSNGLLRMC